MNIEEVHKHLNNGGWLTNGPFYIKGLSYCCADNYVQVPRHQHKFDAIHNGCKLRKQGETVDFKDLPENITTWTIPQQERY